LTYTNLISATWGSYYLGKDIGIRYAVDNNAYSPSNLFEARAGTGFIK